MATAEVSSPTSSSVGGTAPYSRAIRIAAGISLILAGVLNGIPQFVAHLVTADLEFVDYLRWGAENPGFVFVEQLAMVTSVLFAPIGLLAVAQVTRWRARVLTAIAAPLIVWGMWGFTNILSTSYLMAVTAPASVGIESAVGLSDGLSADPGSIVLMLAPHILGSFVGLVLLSIAGWKSRAFSRIPLVLLVIFLVWDFLLPAFGPLEPHILLLVAWAWLGIDLIRMPAAVWRGGIKAV